MPVTMKQSWGRIINFSCIAPSLRVGMVKAMAKTRIIGFTRGLARKFAPYDITANCIGPSTLAVERDAFRRDEDLRPSQPIPTLLSERK